MSNVKKVAADYEYALDDVKVTNLNAGCVVRLKWEASKLSHHGHTDSVTVGLDGCAKFHLSTIDFTAGMKPAPGVADEWAPKTIKFTLLEMPKGADHHRYSSYDQEALGIDDREPVDELDNRKKKKKKAKKKKAEEPVDDSENDLTRDKSPQPGLFTRLKEKRKSRKIAECVLQLAYFVDVDKKHVVIEMERLKLKHRRDGSLEPLMVSANPLLAMNVTSKQQQKKKKEKQKNDEQEQEQTEQEKKQKKGKQKKHKEDQNKQDAEQKT